MKTEKTLLPSWQTINGVPRLEYYRQYNAARRDETRAWHQSHPRSKASRKAEYARHRERQLAEKKAQYAKDPDKFRAASKARRQKRTPEQIERDCEYQRRYRAIHGKRLNKEKIAKINSLVELRVLRALRGRINASIKRAKRTVEFVKKCDLTKNLIGCSVDALIAHIESQFAEGMHWGNHGLRGWHIDHILPCASFDMADPEQQRKCFHYTNLQPLWGSDNIRKKDNILTPQENEQLRM